MRVTYTGVKFVGFQFFKSPLYQGKILDFHSVVFGWYRVEVVKITDASEYLHASFITVDLWGCYDWPYLLYSPLDTLSLKRSMFRRKLPYRPIFFKLLTKCAIVVTECSCCRKIRIFWSLMPGSLKFFLVGTLVHLTTLFIPHAGHFAWMPATQWSPLFRLPWDGVHVFNILQSMFGLYTPYLKPALISLYLCLLTIVPSNKLLYFARRADEKWLVTVVR
jgi:hypothetical protein